VLSINRKRPLVTLAVVAGLLAVAGPASASDSEAFIIKGNEPQGNLSRKGGTVPQDRSCKWEVSEYDA
jgi:hypothetical protein